MRIPETLLTIREVCDQMGIGRETLRRILPGLKAAGLQVVQIAPRSGTRPIVRFRASTLDKAIERLARREAVVGANT